MPRVVEFHPAAIAEAAEARRWYHARSEHMGEAFMGEMDRAVEAISSSPERWPQVEEHTQRYLLRRFPYAVIYRPRPERVLVVAVAHMRRRPGYWRGRH